MKYGKLDDIYGIDFSLPPDHPITADVLPGIPTETDIRLAGTMWTIKDWVGSWYPAGTRPADFLHHYSRIFNSIELNATHYRIPSADQVIRWKEETVAGFLFCPKFPQSISHYRRFRNSEDITTDFLTAVYHFEDKLGPSFIQLPPNFSPGQSASLIEYLRRLPSDFHVAVEFRHPEWFDPDNSLANEMWSLMKESRITAVLSDTAGRRDAVHMRLTTPNAIVRFGGNSQDDSDMQRLNDWAVRVDAWSRRGLNSFHLWMHQPNSILSPESCVSFAKFYQKVSGRMVHVPQRQTGSTLF